MGCELFYQDDRQLRCPDCGHISVKKAKWGFYCQNPKCNVNLILGSNAVILLNTKPNDD